MFQIMDAKLRKAFENLRKNSNFTEKIAEMEKSGVVVQIMSSPTADHSTTEVLDDGYKFYLVTINSKGDDELAKRKWGISGTNEENSVADELGHVYWDYLRHVKKKTN